MQAVLTAAAMVPASIPSPDWSGFDIPLPWGSLRIHAYALCILAGIVVGLWLTSVRWVRRGAPEGSVWDIAIWAIPFGIIGGRLYHVVSSPDAYFGPGFDGTGDLSLIPQIQRGGLGIWGAVVLGAVGAWIGCRRSGVKLSAFLDAAAPGLLLAQAIGRWGNYFNQELFGSPTTLPWGLQIDADNPNFPAGMPAGTLFHPTFLYESLWNLAGVGILLLLDRGFNFRRSRLFWLYAIYYTLGRVWIEAMRIDDAEQINLFGITARLNVWTSLLVLLVALGTFIVLGLRKPTDADTPYLPGREPAAVGAGTKADTEPGTEYDPEPGPESDAKPGAEPVAVPVAGGIRHSDSAVSDSESRANLPDNQSGPGDASARTETSAEASTEAAGGTTPAGGASAAGASGRHSTGSATEAGGTK
ncbi:prolipoprotein diacylglyceryl transferase [Arthrobacter sp. B3I9]|uniref:prolipoprotein diacylglyceryl transferase n=1 Tax=Arthrobacter sp. B3I9 TaxID=3042270 RepID=UPI002794272A|nr:prolipoprotein diacylglyceryl transferase [Arthrobacter sp. B3I9]MDQ0850689.1 prolipoprotein diacylglyceryl transferase [Arthrobacter sp. B3I9]